MGFGADLALSAIPSFGAIGAAALQRHWAIKDWNRVNAYNHPKAQIGRLKEAGLPLASMFSGSGGSTSTDVRGSSVDPTLGAAAGLQAYFQNRLQKKQLLLLDAQIRAENADADQKEGYAAWLKKQTKGLDGTDTTNQAYSLDLDRDTKESQNIIKENEAFISNIEAEVKSQLHTEGKLTDEFLAKLTHILNSNKLLEQQFQDRELFLEMNRQVIRDIIEGGTGLEGVGRLIKAVFANFLLRNSRQ